ncbi:hypothetical protein C0J52_04287 [Blattella germanica]|nr:hypothetical protein C0J52_04287 [Blattella germanica]
MSLPIIQPQAFFGLTCDIKGNAKYVGDHEIFYPAGGVLVLHHYTQNVQRYIKLSEKQRPINIICVNNVKNVVAVAERGEKPCITIYDLEKLKKRKVLGQTLETVAEEFVSLAFSFDGKYLAAVLGSPDWTTLFRLLTASEKIWRQYGWSKTESLNFTCCTWLSFDRVLAGTTDGRLIFIDGGELRAIYQAVEAPDIEFQLVGQQLHHGPIVGLSVCTWKPLFMTCGLIDCTVRVWNYEEDKLELIKQCQDEIHSVAIHPTDKLRFMLILLDDIQPWREFSIRACNNVSFSSSGHMFAAVNGNIIQIYSSVSFESILNLRGHNGKVRSMVWTKGDNKMVSCGNDGAIYEWDLVSGTRVHEIITKEVIYSGVVSLTSGDVSYATGTDMCITEVSNSTVVSTMPVGEEQLENIVLSRSNLMMFLGNANGSILSVTFPPKEPFTFNTFHIHNKPITKMLLTYNDLYMITCAVDGTLCIWKLTFTEGKSVKIDKDFKLSEQVLIAERDLVEKQNMIRELLQRIEELETEHGYQMQKADEKNAEKVKEVHEGYIAAMEELKEKNEQLENDHTLEMNAINADIAKMKTNHSKDLADMEASFTEKLIVEYDKYQALEARTSRMREDYETKLETLHEKREVDISEMQTNFETLEKEHTVQIEEMQISAEHRKQEHESIKQQIEEDADYEIVEIKTNYEQLLYEEQEKNLKLRGETGDKEKRISDLKQKNQELDKFKFVLNYKIAELKNQIEPKDREIKQKKEQIQDMELELENLQKVNTSLDLQLAELREKLSATNNELIKEHQENRSKNALLRRIRFDLHNASGLIQEPKQLKDTVRQLYHKYSQDSDFVTSRGEDIDAQTEFMRQREHLERTVTSLKKQVFKETGCKQEMFKIMEARDFTNIGNGPQQLENFTEGSAGKIEYGSTKPPGDTRPIPKQNQGLGEHDFRSQRRDASPREETQLGRSGRLKTKKCLWKNFYYNNTKVECNMKLKQEVCIPRIASWRPTPCP